VKGFFSYFSCFSLFFTFFRCCGGLPRYAALTKNTLHVLGNILFSGRQKRIAFLSESGVFLVLLQGSSVIVVVAA